MKMNANTDRDTLLHALTNANKAAFSDQIINQIIEAEMSKPDELIDNELLDACFRLSERRHSPFTNKELSKSKRQGFKQLRKSMKRHGNEVQSKRPFALKLVAVSALVVAIILLPILNMGLPFRITTTPNKEQYLVVGVTRFDHGIVRALGNRNANGGTYYLNSLEEIAPLLGYRVELPKWIPDGCELAGVQVVRTMQYDEVFVVYAGDNRSVSIELTYFDSRTGSGSSYEQNEKGQKSILASGASIYVADNQQSSWGLFQTPKLEYFIEATGYDKQVIIEIFNSFGG